ncbi:hypothetical protein UlMin_041810 [Ulmus minor]
MSSHYMYQTSPYRMNYTKKCTWHIRINACWPDILYQYQCGNPKQGMISGPKRYPSKIVVVGDLGLTYNTTSTIEHLTSNYLDLVLLLGGVSYADLYLLNGTRSDCYYCSFPQMPIHESYQPCWDYWGRYMQPLPSSVPIMVVERNHEREEQIKHQTFVAYSSRVAFPSNESKSSFALYYSFNAGGVHFIMLKKDLAKFNRKVTSWLVATWHPPWYSTYKAHYREAECMRVAIWRTYSAIHAYERSNRVYNYTLDPCGPVYITIGDGGNRERMAITHADEPCKCLELEYSAYIESSFGHGILENKDSYKFVGDLIYIVRYLDKCPIKS